MKILCNDCQHSKVCKFKQVYLDTVNNLTIDVPTPFDLTLTCPNYTVNPSSYYQYLNCNGLANSISSICSDTCSTAESAVLTNEAHQLTFDELGLE